MCEINLYGVSECVCPQVCIATDAPVCGSDVRIALSLPSPRPSYTLYYKFALLVRSFTLSPCIKVWESARVGEKVLPTDSNAICARIVCLPSTIGACGPLAPVCALSHSLSLPTCFYVLPSSSYTQGNTYPNECEMRVRSCGRKVDIHVKSVGPCSEFSLISTLLLTPNTNRVSQTQHNTIIIQQRGRKRENVVSTH